jgi:hypothetical protein
MIMQGMQVFFLGLDLDGHVWLWVQVPVGTRLSIIHTVPVCPNTNGHGHYYLRPTCPRSHFLPPGC